jgi:hypothetical protein
VRRIERKHDKLVARIDALRAEILQTDFADQERQPQTNSNIAGVDLPSDAHPTARAIADAMYGRMTGKAPEGAGREWMGRSLCEMGRVLIEIGGERPAPTRNGLLDQMLTHRAGLHPTSDFPNLLQSSANRVLLSAFEAAQSPLRALARERMVADFRSITMLRLSEAPKLEKVNEHGEIKRGTRAESKEGYKVSTFAKIFGLTREAIINDDLGAFADAATAFGQAAAQTEADEIVALFTDNSGNGVTLDDGDQLYTTGRGNKAGSGAAPDVTTLGAARKALRDMKGLDGVTPLNIVPRYLVTGSALETAVEQLLTTTLYATEVDNANPFNQGKIIGLVEPRFTGNAWRLFADPASLPAFSCAHLDGMRGPQFQMREGWDVLGVEYRCVMDFGCGVEAGGWRGTYLNAGA